MAMSKGFRVLEKKQPPSPHSVILEHRNKSETLLFESQAVAVLSAQETDAIRRQYVKIADAYGCLGVLQLNAGETSVLFLVLVTGCFSVGKIGDAEVFRITQTQFVSLQHQLLSEEKISEVRKLLNSGTFYFAWNTSPVNQQVFDITICAQRKRRTTETDNRFFWNRMLHIHLMRYSVDCDFWLLRAVCGSVEIRTVYAGSRQARAAIISRLSCERAGTRFNVRGTNDEGHVANFVETEQVIYLDSDVTSYVQTRGSVPLFWEQPGVQVGSHKVKLSRGFEASKVAFERHMNMMRCLYNAYAIVNLLGTSLIGSKEGEAMLSNEFQRHHKESQNSDVPHIVFDYHQECRGGNMTALGKLKARLEGMCAPFGLFFAADDEIMREQRGVIRTNCLDCLDRTNCVQTFFGLEILNEQIQLLGLGDKKQMLSRFEEVFKQMWINNGNEVSKIYAGTGAIQGGSKLMDGARSAARTIQNNLLDNSKQEAIDILIVGSTLSSELADRARILLPSNMLHAPTPVLREMCMRYAEYVTPKPLRVAVGTYNVNGGKHFRSVVYKDVSLADWLLDSHLLARTKSLVDVSYDTSPEEEGIPIDIFAVGFQEIVDLNASNIMAASSDNAKAWAEELQRVMSREHPYVLLTSQQLVGVCLFVFVRPEQAQYIRDVAVDSVKTGLGGATGNKGAAAIRFVIHGTSICFVCAHFAAGQSQVTERNADYAEITRKIAFPMGRSLKSHDYVFWCGDFNYRIDMDKDEIKDYVQQGQLEPILEHDQLRKQQDAGQVFGEFLEGEITFPPTYKYDLFSDDYDTSEKARAPAWTDRVLWKRRKPHPDADKSPDWNNGQLVHYGRSELKQSDHRPVIAIIDIEVAEINETCRQKVFKEVMSDLGPPDATIVVQTEDASEEDRGEGSIYDENIMTALIQELAQIGEVTLVRYVGETMWVTFRDGQSALTAAKKKRLQVCGVELLLKLKTDNWLTLVEQEIAICSPNTVPFCDSNLTNSSVTPDYNCLGIPEVPMRPPGAPGVPAKPPPPSRPPLPKSPQASPKHMPSRAGVISVTADILSKTKPAVPPPPAAMSHPARPPPPPAVPCESPVPEPSPTTDTGAIYEEINDDIEIPKPREPAPVLPPQPNDVYDLDSTPARSPAKSVPPSAAPPPLPMRRNAPPPIPGRSGIPPPLPARPNNQNP
ncbi:synaptojanin-1 isoform X1 [Phlebotomus papatasi]|uniref:synaptojanin-1 isoform X1 n=1 Tax=Phlebotomus papatasi TaxID=29031 RepID=UPI00248457A1|nr:synaptojanin-1 isoform X1 [Phlebotomus papatasi]